jgi:hypothetical protein
MSKLVMSVVMVLAMDYMMVLLMKEEVLMLRRDGDDGGGKLGAASDAILFQLADGCRP